MHARTRARVCAGLSHCLGEMLHSDASPDIPAGRADADTRWDIAIRRIDCRAYSVCACARVRIVHHVEWSPSPTLI